MLRNLLCQPEPTIIWVSRMLLIIRHRIRRKWKNHSRLKSSWIRRKSRPNRRSNWRGLWAKREGLVAIKIRYWARPMRRRIVGKSRANKQAKVQHNLIENLQRDQAQPQRSLSVAKYQTMVQYLNAYTLQQ